MTNTDMINESTTSDTWMDIRGRMVRVTALPCADGWQHYTHWFRDNEAVTVPSLHLPWPVAQQLADLISSKDGGYERANV
jgi:hypothetical protein